MYPDTFRPEPRCHVCRDEPVKEQVNDMLARGSSYAGIVRVLAAQGYDVSLDSVRNHANRHFPAQNAAGATYREIVERRAGQCKVDFENGVATALTPIAYMEAMMVKGFQNLVRDDTEVSPEMGFKAAEKLHKAIGAVDPLAEKARMVAELYQIIDLVKALLPRDKWPELQAGLAQLDSLGIDLSAQETVEPQELPGPDEVIVVPIDPGEGDDDF